MKLYESGEMYLETILILSNKIKNVRAIDIVTEMGFSKPAVSRAMNKLKNDKYIIIDHDGFITLSETGRKVAENVYEKHQILTKFLLKLGVSENTASIDACKIEHDISEETFDAIKNQLK